MAVQDVKEMIVFKKAYGYIHAAEHAELVDVNREVGCMLGSMFKTPGKFLISQDR